MTSFRASAPLSLMMRLIFLSVFGLACLCSKPVHAGTWYYVVSDNNGSNLSGTSPHGDVDGQSNAGPSDTSTNSTFQDTFTWTLYWVPGNSQDKPPLTVTLNVGPAAYAYAEYGNGQDNPVGNFSVDDGFGDAQTSTMEGSGQFDYDYWWCNEAVVESYGSHLVTVQVDTSKGTFPDTGCHSSIAANSLSFWGKATFPSVTASASVNVTDTVPGAGYDSGLGYGGLGSTAYVGEFVYLDNRGANASIQGLTTYHKGALFYPNGQPEIDPTTGLQEMGAVANTPVGNTLQADIALPDEQGYAEIIPVGPGPFTSISKTYAATVYGGTNYPDVNINGGDTYDWSCALHGDSSSGYAYDVGLGGGTPTDTDYNIGTQSTLYRWPWMDGNLALHPEDTGKTDTVTFKYFFTRNGATATAIVATNLHAQVENWTKDGTPVFTGNATYPPSSPLPPPANGGVPVSVPLDDIDYGGDYIDAAELAADVSTHLVGAFIEGPEGDIVASLLAAGSWVIQKSEPPPPQPVSIPTPYAQFASDIQTQVNLDDLNYDEYNPPPLPDTRRFDPGVAQYLNSVTNPQDFYSGVYGGCHVQIYPYRPRYRQNFVGDKYGSNGYVSDAHGYVDDSANPKYDVFYWTCFSVAPPKP